MTTNHSISRPSESSARYQAGCFRSIPRPSSWYSFSDSVMLRKARDSLPRRTLHTLFEHHYLMGGNKYFVLLRTLGPSFCLYFVLTPLFVFAPLVAHGSGGRSRIMHHARFLTVPPSSMAIDQSAVNNFKDRKGPTRLTCAICKRYSSYRWCLPSIPGLGIHSVLLPYDTELCAAWCQDTNSPYSLSVNSDLRCL
jgi:hypothetical protein